MFILKTNFQNCPNAKLIQCGKRLDALIWGSRVEPFEIALSMSVAVKRALARPTSSLSLLIIERWRSLYLKANRLQKAHTPLIGYKL